MTLKRIIPILISANMFMPMTTYAANLTLEDAVSKALINNLELMNTKEGTNVAKASFDAAKGQAGFTVSARDGISFSKQEDSDFSSSNSMSISGSYSLYNGGKTKNTIKSSEMGVDIAELEIEQAKNDLVMNVTKAYYDVLEARDDVKVKQETVDNYTAHLNVVQNLYTGGAKAKVDVLRTEVELANAEQSLTKAKVGYETKMAKLKNYMNDSQELNPTLVSVVRIASDNNDVNYYVAYAEEHRPDIKINNYKVKQAELNLESAKAENKPTVSASAGISRNDDLSNGRDGKFDFSTGVSVNWNIFDGGVTKAHIAEKDSMLKKVNLSLMNSKSQADLNVRTAYLNVNEAQSRFNSTAKAIQKAEEDYRIALVKYTAGEGLMVDVIDAQTALTTAKQNHFNAQYDYARHRAELNNAIGVSYQNGNYYEGENI